MPLDGSGFHGSERLEKMDAVIGHLSDESRWCKGQLVSRDGSRCIVGAIQAADGMGELERPVLLAIRQVTGHRYRRIEAFNDAPSTNHGLVVEVLHRARGNILNDAAEAPSEVTMARCGWWRSIFAYAAQFFAGM